MSGREKDCLLLKAIVKLGVIDLAFLRKACQQAAMGDATAATAGRTLRRLVKECGLE